MAHRLALTDYAHNVIALDLPERGAEGRGAGNCDPHVGTPPSPSYLQYECECASPSALRRLEFAKRHKVAAQLLCVLEDVCQREDACYADAELLPEDPLPPEVEHHTVEALRVGLARAEALVREMYDLHAEEHTTLVFAGTAALDSDPSDPPHRGDGDLSITLPTDLLLNCGSSFFATALTGSTWVEAKTGVLHLAADEGFEGPAVLALVCYLFDHSLVDRIMLTATVVNLFRIGFFLDLPEIQDCAQDIMSKGIEEQNVAYMLSLATNLYPEPKLLLMRTRAFVVRQFHHPADMPGWDLLEPEVQAEINSIKGMATQSPARWTGDLDSVFNAREMLAVLKEMLGEQKERYNEAVRRSQEPGGSNAYVQNILQGKMARIALLTTYIQQQTEALEIQQRLEQRTRTSFPEL